MSNSNELIELDLKSQTRGRQLSLTGKLLLGATGGLGIGLTIICAPFISPALRKHCLPYIPATKNQIDNIIAALQHRPKGGTLVDLGSGDGRIVLETSQRGFEAHGVELNYWLVLFSKFDAFRKGLTTRSKFFRHDLWTFPLHKYDNIVIFGVEQMMQDLEKKFEAECKSDCCVIACRFPLPNKAPVKTIGHGVDTVWIYNFC